MAVIGPAVLIIIVAIVLLIFRGAKLPKPAGSVGQAQIEPAEEMRVQDPWKQFANCLGVDPDLFFPERGASTKEAKRVCSSCVVRSACLEYALGNGEKFGIWGGMSERERRRVRRERALARQQTSGSVTA